MKLTEKECQIMSNEMNVNEMISELDRINSLYERHQSLTASMDNIEAAGWKAFESNRNRYALINNLMDEAFKKYRIYYYDYHRHGLDEMVGNVANGRARIAKDMKVLKEAYNARPATYVVNAFLDAKSDELVNIFKKGTSEEKKMVYELLMDIDPTRQSTYDEINRD